MENTYRYYRSIFFIRETPIPIVQRIGIGKLNSATCGTKRRTQYPAVCRGIFPKLVLGFIPVILTVFFIIGLPAYSHSEENTTGQKPLPVQNADKRQEALRQLNKSITDNSNDAEAYLKRGKIYLSLEDQQKAIADFTRAIELKPTYAE